MHGSADLAAPIAYHHPHPAHPAATIRHDSVVSPNLAVGDVSDVSVYPSTCRVGNTIVCVYRRGSAKHSRDGVLLAQSSSDGGKSWSPPACVFDQIGADEPESVHVGVVCALGDKVVAFFKTVEAKKADVYIFSEEGRQLRQNAYMCSSIDGGRHWNAPVKIDLLGGPRDTFLGSRPLTLPGGRLLIPVEATGQYGQQFMMGMFSDDGGKTVSPLFDIAHDVTGRLGFGDGKLSLLPDGRMVMHVWTYLNETEETIAVHRCVSSDGGRTWTPPEPTNVVCQIMNPIVLPTGTLLAAGTVRTHPAGIRLFQSLDGGATWNGTPIQLWDEQELRITGVPLAITSKLDQDEKLWAALPSFAFGWPELTRLPDEDVLLTYYACVNEITHIRACRFAVGTRRHRSATVQQDAHA